MYCNCSHCDTRDIMNIEENLERCTLSSSHGNIHDGTEIGVGLIPLSSPNVLDGEEPRGPETDSNASSTSEVDLHQPNDSSPNPSISSHETLGEPPALAVSNSEPSSSSNGISYINLSFCDAEDIDSADHAEPSTSGLQNPVPKSKSPCHLPATKPIQDTGNSGTTTLSLNASKLMESPIVNNGSQVDNTNVNQSLVSRMFETVSLWSYYFKSSNEMRIRGVVSYVTLIILIVTNGINISNVLIISSKISPVCTNLWIYPFIGLYLLDNFREIYLWHHRCNTKQFSIWKPVYFDSDTVIGLVAWLLMRFIQLTSAVFAFSYAVVLAGDEDVSRSKAQYMASGPFLSTAVLLLRIVTLFFYEGNCICGSKRRSLRQKVILLMFNYLITLSLIILYIISYESYMYMAHGTWHMALRFSRRNTNLFVFNIQFLPVVTAIMNNMIIVNTVIRGADCGCFETTIHILLGLSIWAYFLSRTFAPTSVDSGRCY